MKRTFSGAIFEVCMKRPGYVLNNEYFRKNSRFSITTSSPSHLRRSLLLPSFLRVITIVQPTYFLGFAGGPLLCHYVIERKRDVNWTNAMQSLFI